MMNIAIALGGRGVLLWRIYSAFIFGAERELAAGYYIGALLGL
jgi:hypothetical protein